MTSGFPPCAPTDGAPVAVPNGLSDEEQQKIMVCAPGFNGAPLDDCYFDTGRISFFKPLSR